MKKKKITIALSRAAKIMLACLITLIAMTGCGSSANSSSAKDEDDKTQTSSFVQTTAPVPNNGMSSAATNDNSSSIGSDDFSSSIDESSKDESSKDESSSLASESVVVDSSSSNSDNSTVDGPIATTRDADGLYEYALYGTRVKMGVNINEYIKPFDNGEQSVELYRLAATYNWSGDDTYSDPEDQNYKALSSTFFTHRSGELKTDLRPLNYSATIDEFGGQQLSYLLVDFLREDGENYYSEPNEAKCNLEVNFEPHSGVCTYRNVSANTWKLSQEDLILLAFIIWHEDQYPGTNALNSYPDLKKVAIYYSAPLGEQGKARYLFS